MEGLIEGRIVHYVLREGANVGQHRPAMVVRVWRGADGEPPANGVCQLNVFVDGTNDFPSLLREGFNLAGPSCWQTSVLNDEVAKGPGTWHWIERA